MTPKAIFQSPETRTPGASRGCLRLMFRWAFQFLAVVIIFGGIAFLFAFRGPLYNRYFLFPSQARAWDEIRAQHEPVSLDDGWTEYRGVCHSHSKISHDSEMEFEDILKAAKIADINFICMSDHCVDGKADYSWGWKGMHDDVLFIRGFEMDYGFMPWGLPDDTVLQRDADPELLAQEIAQKGGVLFIAHSEEERYWEIPQINGMEIYNIHTDVKDEGYGGSGFLIQMLAGYLLSSDSYGDQLIRTIFDRQTRILHLWDDLNRTRRMVGIAASDAHQNLGFRVDYTPEGKLRVRETGPDDGKLYELNALTRFLVEACFGPLEPGRQLFRIDLDRYERSLRFVNTHILARDLTESEVIDALRQGRVFVAFDMIADARGFTCVVRTPRATATFGEEIAFEDGLELLAESPYPCRFTLVRDGVEAAQREGRTFLYTVREPGNYRIEAELNVLGEWTPWVYGNPIRVVRRKA